MNIKLNDQNISQREVSRKQHAQQHPRVCNGMAQLQFSLPMAPPLSVRPRYHYYVRQAFQQHSQQSFMGPTSAQAAWQRWMPSKK